MPGAVEIALVYGGVLTFQSNGDLQLSQDTPTSPQATFERVLRIVLTNPTTTDGNGNPIGRPDDLFHPSFGSGVKAAIGEPGTPALVQAVSARIIAAIQADPYIATSPAPTVSLTQLTIGTWQLIVTCSAISGEPFTLPSFIISTTGLVTGA